MKTTLAELLDPTRSYRSIGELARTLQFLLTGANEFRTQGKWGSCGPHETLVNYNGCTNCFNIDWHSQRMVAGGQDKCPVPSWQQHHDCLFNCILSCLCESSTASVAWRAKHGISLQTPLKFPMAYQHCNEEQSVWKEFESLHGHKLQHVSTLNSCHRRVNVLCDPELRISKSSIRMTCQVTDRRELRTSPLCHSRWNVCRLLADKKHNWLPSPKWNPRRETFAAFILRGVEFYKNVKQPRK